MSAATTTTIQPVYVSRVSVRVGQGPDKCVTIPSEADPIVMGAHGIIAERLGVPECHITHASTLDYLVAAAAACLTGTFARAMKARSVAFDEADYRVCARGEIYDDRGVLVLRRIEVCHRLRIPPERHELVERVHRVYRKGCAVSRSLAGAIALDSVLILE